MVLSFPALVVAVMVLFVVLTSHGVKGCHCPSCHFTDAAQNCQCCIYRQLGKRSDPALTLRDLPVPSDSAGFLYLPHEPTTDVLLSSAPSLNRVEDSDWSSKLKSGYHYDDDTTGTNDVMMSGLDDINGLRWSLGVATRANRKLSALSRLLGSSLLHPSWKDGDLEGASDYSN